MIKIIGGNKLTGKVKISGAKNAILPILAATLLTDEQIIIDNVPDLSDVHIMLNLLQELGSEVDFDIPNHRIIIHPTSEICSEINNIELANKIRTSSLFLGPLLTRTNYVKIPKPGGCKIGSRLIDIHLKFLCEMGGELEECEEFIRLKTEVKLNGVVAKFAKNSVGATQNIMMAASLAAGTTIIHNAAIEPEVVDLGNFLIKMGAQISGLTTQKITIQGVEKLNGCSYSIIADRIEAGSYAIAGLITKGEVLLQGANYHHLKYFFDILQKTGAIITQSDEGILVTAGEKIISKSIVTAPYPYFPTDLQQVFASLMCLSNSYAIIEENIFENRFVFAHELIKMGAKIYFPSTHKMIIEGTIALHAATVDAPDLRGGMALLLAALTAEGETIINNSFYIERGYENFIEKFSHLGVGIMNQI